MQCERRQRGRELIEGRLLEASTLLVFGCRQPLIWCAPTGRTRRVKVRALRTLGLVTCTAGDGSMNKKRWRHMPGSRRGPMRQAHARRFSSASNASAAEDAFKFGYRYTHFLYSLSTRPPHRLLSSSAEFCIGSAQDQTDCESVQFVSGLVVATEDMDGALQPNHESRGCFNGTLRAPVASKLLMSFGVNDCEARWPRLLSQQLGSCSVL